MAQTVIDEFGHLETYRLDVVEAGKCHVAVQVGCGGAWMDGENLQWSVALLEFHRHHPHHGILGGLAGDVGQGMPVGTDFRRNGDIDNSDGEGASMPW